MLRDFVARVFKYTFKILPQYFQDSFRVLSGYFHDTFGILLGYFQHTFRILLRRNALVSYDGVQYARTHEEKDFRI